MQVNFDKYKKSFPLVYYWLNSNMNQQSTITFFRNVPQRNGKYFCTKSFLTV